MRSSLGRSPVTERSAGFGFYTPASGRFEDEDLHAVANHLGVGEPQSLLVARLAEEPLPAPEHDRVDHQPELVDQIVLDQRLHELSAARDENVPVDLLLQ